MSGKEQYQWLTMVTTCMVLRYSINELLKHMGSRKLTIPFCLNTLCFKAYESLTYEIHEVKTTLSHRINIDMETTLIHH